MQSSKQGISERGFQLLIEGIERGTFFVINGILKGQGLDLGAELSLKNFVENAPGEQVISDIKDTMQYITQILRISAGVG